MAELGLGIHGEAGVEQIQYTDARQAMDAVCGKLVTHLGDGKHVALLNNLGGTSVLEMAVLANELAKSEIAGKLKWIVGPAAMVTSLDMRGFSVSVYPATVEDMEALSDPTPLPAWPGVSEISPVTVRNLPDGLAPIKPLPSEHTETRDFLTRCCEVLIASERDLNVLDAKTGDGDTGSTLAGAARALIASMDTLPLADHTQLYRALGQELSQTMGGSSGVLLAIFFAAAGDAASSGLSMTGALKAGLARMQEIGGANLGDRTMVDALHPALDALDESLAKAAQAARAGAEHTATLTKANAGRATYINAQQLKGYTDPGAEAVARLFEHLQG
jgi:dihydroxyacetone kinase